MQAMTQLPLLLDSSEGIQVAAKSWGITKITVLPTRIATFRAVKNGGASGPDLTDYEAAVLIASGIPWGVWEPWRRP